MKLKRIECLTLMRVEAQSRSANDSMLLSRLAGTVLPFARAAVGGGRRCVSLRHDAYADVAPMRGSKRIPMLEIAENGAASSDLWCASARAQAFVADGSISISRGELQNSQCEPDRQALDAELLAALTQVTNWRRQGDVIELLGVTPLRFWPMTN